MSTHRGRKVRVSNKNKKRLESRRDEFGFKSQNDVIDMLFESSFTISKKKKKLHNGFRF